MPIWQESPVTGIYQSAISQLHYCNSLFARLSVTSVTLVIQSTLHQLPSQEQQVSSAVSPLLKFSISSKTKLSREIISDGGPRSPSQLYIVHKCHTGR